VKKQVKKQAASKAADASRRSELAGRIKRYAAYGMIAFAVIAAYFIAPLPIAIGLTVLAAVRLLILAWQERKGAGAESPNDPSSPRCAARSVENPV